MASENLSPFLKVSFVAFYGTVFLLSSLGNSWVIKTCYKSLKGRHQFPLMWLVANLAFADLLFTFLTVLNVIDVSWHWVGGNITCRLHGFLVEATYTTSITTLVLITFQRLRAVTDPLNARINSLSSKEQVKLSIVWFLCLAVCSPLVDIYRLERRGNVHVCVNTTWGDIGRQVYYSLHATFFFVLPFLYMIFTQTLISRALRSRFVPAINNSFIEKSVQGHKKVAKTLMALTIAFAICWSPFMVTRTLIYFHLATPGIVWRASQLLICLNAALDPILYGYYGGNLKSALKRFVKCDYARKRDSNHTSMFIIRSNVSRFAGEHGQRGPYEDIPSANFTIQSLNASCSMHKDWYCWQGDFGLGTFG